MLGTTTGGVGRPAKRFFDVFGKTFAVMHIAVVNNQVWIEARGHARQLGIRPGGFAAAVLQAVAGSAASQVKTGKSTSLAEP